MTHIPNRRKAKHLAMAAGLLTATLFELLIGGDLAAASPLVNLAVNLIWLMED